MTVRTHIRQALDRVADEQTQVAEKRAAFEEFERSVRDLTSGPQGGDVSASSPSTDGSLTVSVSTGRGARPSENRCQYVREAFAETVQPHSGTDLGEPESLVETMAEELSEDLAMLLAPETPGQFTAQTKQALLAAVSQRQAELSVMARALDAEAESLRAASDDVEEIIGWLVEADQTRLTERDFDALHTTHEELATRRTRCDEIARDRQEHLHSTTSRDATVGLSHRSLVDHLYAELPVAYPVLVTVTRLDDVCAECQRVVRDHLVRRV